MSVQTIEQLTSKRCVPCEGGVPKLSPEEAEQQIKSLSGWHLTHNGQRIRKDWVSKHFVVVVA